MPLRLMEEGRLFKLGAMSLKVEKCRVGFEDICLMALVVN